MHEQVNWNLLARHLAGECTAEESAQLEAWLAESPDRKQFLAELEEVWEVTGPAASHRDADRDVARDVDALWQRVQGHMARPERTPPRSAREPAQPRRIGRPRADRRPARRLHRAAAVVAALAGVLLLVLWMGDGLPFGGADTSAKVFATERGQRATVRLADGTMVRLNAASTLTVEPAFGTSTRSVRLEGEAYFDVARDTTRPFLVHAGPATAQVLGTSFNVSAYAGEGRVRVVVAEGRVALRAHPQPAAEDGSPQGGPDQAAGADALGVVLTADQMGELDDRGGVVRRAANATDHLEWTAGHLVFKDAPFREVTRRLSRWYDVDVVVPEGTAPAGHLNARFTEQQPLTEVLQVIATVFALRFEQKRGAVHFYPQDPPPPASPEATRST